MPRTLSRAPHLPPLDPRVGALEVTGISLDSRDIVAGDIYAALPGTNVHGGQFAADAVAVGAVVVVTDSAGCELAAQCGAPVVVVANPRATLGNLSAWVYGDPSESLTVVGVTGTNGKTTTCALLEAAWQRAGLTTGVIGTLAIHIANDHLPATRTTPEAPELHALLAVMAEAGVTHVAMEVSSHALRLGRVDGVHFALAVFTNLGNDHLDFHVDMEDYFAAKVSLFDPVRAKRGLVCVDDIWGQRLAATAPIPITTYSVPATAVATIPPEQVADWFAYDVQPKDIGWRYHLAVPDTVAGPGTVAIPDSDAATSLSLPGLFNVSNAIAAAAAAIALGSDRKAVLDGIASCPGVPGRMEAVNEGQDFSVIVDYAHTPDAVALALGVGRGLAGQTQGRLIVVFGGGGDRDTEKRPKMAAVATRLADVVIVTDDNPRSEDPAEIRRQILAGALTLADQSIADRLPSTIAEIAPREAALNHAIRIAQTGDVVLALGKGHEVGQEVAGVVYPLDDREVLRAAIRATGQRATGQRGTTP